MRGWVVAHVPLPAPRCVFTLASLGRGLAGWKVGPLHYRLLDVCTALGGRCLLHTIHHTPCSIHHTPYTSAHGTSSLLLGASSVQCKAQETS